MLVQHEDYLAVHWTPAKISRYHWIWLRDSCPCPECFNANCRQKYFDTSRIPLDMKPVAIRQEGESVRINWVDHHESTFALSWLHSHDYSCLDKIEDEPARSGPDEWPTTGLSQCAVFGRIDVLEDDCVLNHALDTLVRFGITIIQGEGGSAEDFSPICDRLAGLLDPSYFGQFFDLVVKPDYATDSVSFSTKELPLHTDIPYYAPPPDFQFLYGLEVSKECTARGLGRTRFVDGFTAARALRREHPTMFEALTTIKVVYRAEYPWARKIYESRTPIIIASADGSIQRLVNNPSKMFFDGVPFNDMVPLYRAYQTFKHLLMECPASYSHTWSQGDLVVWDNRRVFHGRAEFGAADITRTLRGGYFRDVEVRARSRFLHRTATDAAPGATSQR